MNEQEIVDQFVKLVTNNAGTISSSRLNESYFTKIGKLQLWTAFNNLTDNLKCGIGDRLIFVREGYIKERPRCIVCGNPVTISDRKVSKYCCKQCAVKDPNRSKKISTTKQNQDHTQANEKRKQTMLDKYGVVSELPRC